MRLNKYLANSGIASRRKSDELIKMATTTVNNTPINTLLSFNCVAKLENIPTTKLRIGPKLT